MFEETKLIKVNEEKKIKTFSRSAQLSLKFNHKHRLDSLKLFIEEYRRVANILVKELWCHYGLNENQFEVDIPKFIGSLDSYGIETWLGSRPSQDLAKQVLAIIKGTIKKQKKRAYSVKKLKEEGKFKQARKLQRIIDEQSISCPVCFNINPQLNARVYKDLHFNENKLCWVTIGSLKNKEAKHNPIYNDIPSEIDICFKLHKHFHKLKKNALKINNSISLSNDCISFTFEFEDKSKENKESKNVIGVDIGVNNVFTCSNNKTDIEDNHGWTYSKILDKLSRKKRGSKNFKQASKLRKDYLRWVVKQLGIEKASKLTREDIKDLYREKNVKRKLKHFNYRLIFEVLENYCQKHNVYVETVNQRYTSQRCSACGYVHKRNRSRKKFVCKNCGNTIDADLNASRNISLQLKKLTKKQCKNHLNYSGFFWDKENVFCEASVVPHQQKQFL